MNATQQHLLDTYRAARRAESAPPAPGAHTVRTLRDILRWRRSRTAVPEQAPRIAPAARTAPLHHHAEPTEF
ncbi:hypothetical protein ACH4VT_30125 [Streptomyces lydicus]|uniref:hypothetical protein n=1 Tax=Streptomyces lydicus TaxID=47763 RepID=UPI0037A86A55